MRRVLVISPHFPPDTGAAAHRMRLLAPCLPGHGWEPTIVTVDSAHTGGRTEPQLLRLVHGRVRVERVHALGGSSGRFLGVGDLGLRSLPALGRLCRRLLGRERFDLVLITMPPHYVALLGPWLRRRTGTPYVLDYQDPWVSAWGLTVGGGPDGRPDLKSRLSRKLALAFEPLALSRAAGLTAVSDGTLEGILVRHPALRLLPRAEVPLGGDARDFGVAREVRRANPFFSAEDGLIHLVYVGTLLPLGSEILRAVLRGAVLLRERNPELLGRMRLHFFGTSNQTAGRAPFRVLPEAKPLGLTSVVDEHPLRIDYLDALTVQAEADGILLLGSSEPHYTASKIYPALLSGRPLLAVYHEASSVCEVLRRHGPPGATWLATFGSHGDPATLSTRLRGHLAALAVSAGRPAAGASPPALGEWDASALAEKMAKLLSATVARAPHRANGNG